MGFQDKDEALSLIDYPRVVLEQIEAVLHSVGIELPALFTQLFLFIICLVIFALLLRRKGKDSNQKLASRFGAIGTILIALGILISWATEIIWPYPDVIKGHINLSGLNSETVASLRVELLDARKNTISVEGGWVDSKSGRLSYANEKSLCDRPNKKRIKSNGCESNDIPWKVSELHSRFACIH